GGARPARRVAARRGALDPVRAAADLRPDAETGLPVPAPAVHGAPDRGDAQPRLRVPGAAAGVRDHGAGGLAGAGRRRGRERVRAGGGGAVAVDPGLPAADAEAGVWPGLDHDPAEVLRDRHLLLDPARL